MRSHLASGLLLEPTMFVMFLILTVGLGILEIILRSADRVSEIARRFEVIRSPFTI